MAPRKKRSHVPASNETMRAPESPAFVPVYEKNVAPPATSRYEPTCPKTIRARGAKSHSPDSSNLPIRFSKIRAPEFHNTVSRKSTRLIDCILSFVILPA